MTRQEILQAALKQAEPYLEQGDFSQAWTAHTSELKKHKETKEHLGIELGIQLLMAGFIGDVEKMREHLQGFN